MSSSASGQNGLLEDLLSYSNLVHAIAGATGSVVGMSTFYPLDIVRTRFQADEKLKAVGPLQAMKKLADEEGVEALYRGLGPVLTSLYCSNFVYFYSFNGMKMIANSNGLKASVGRDLVLGYVAGCINAMMTTPLWVTNTRLKLQGVLKDEAGEQPEKKFNGLIDGMRKIAKEEGVHALWNGVEASFILSGNPAIHFMVYEALKRVVLKARGARGKTATLSSFESFVIGGFAKAVATVITYPLQLIQCRLRAKRRSNDGSGSMSSVLEEVLRTSGFNGLYKGMESKLYQTVLTASLMFLSYEKIMALIYTVFKVHQKSKKP
ncbi:peroxisomal membrane protein PMP34-like [Clytia hemisphaerica]|uniref:Uncharacterized protein n=2 Tax=Clytia hemisphaerica TaxID=252671 RepID=A0A7M5UZ32_9CNID